MKGFELIAQFLGDLKWAIRSGDAATISAAWAVADQFRIDCRNASRMGFMVLFSDPFKPSRVVFQAFETQYGRH